MNKILRKIIATLLAIIMTFSVIAIPASAGTADSKTFTATESSALRTYGDKYHNGIISPPITDFFFIFDYINTIAKVLTGIPLFDGETLEFAAEGFIDDTLKDLAETTFFDGYDFFNSIPLPNSSAQRIIDLFNIDVPTMADELEVKIREHNANGETLKVLLLTFFQAYLKQITSLHVYEKKVDDTTYQLICDMTYKYGGTETYDLDFYYDTEKQLFYNKANRGLFKLGFNFDLTTNTLYSSVNSWQRNFGFCLTYDFIANIIIMDYETVRVKFSYGGKDWMFQFWKGRYFVCPGGELGIYTRPESRIGTIYNCAADEDMMNMSIEIYHDNELIFKEGPMKHWWITGFNIGDRYYLPESLLMKGTIEFPNEEMASLFINAASRKRQLTVSRDACLVSYEFK